MPGVESKPGVFAETGLLLRRGLRSVRAGGVHLVGLILVWQLLISLVAFPFFGWLFRETLRASGMRGLDLSALSEPGRGGSMPVTLLLLAVLVTLAFWLISLQFTAIVVLLRWPELSAREYLGELGRVARQLVRPGSLPLVAYLFLLLPLSGFGFTSVLAQGVAIPSFISGELLKSTSTTIALAVFLLLLLWLNLRLALTVPIFVLSNGRRPGRASWRLTRGLRTPVSLALSVAAITLIAGVTGGLLLLAALAPTTLTDAVLPGASVTVAAFSLGAAEVLGVIIAGLATAWIGGVLIARVDRGAAQLPAQVVLVPDPGTHSRPAARGAAGPDPDHNASAPRRSRREAIAVVTVIALVSAGLGAASIAPLQRLAASPASLVLAHRGFSDGGVENTLSGLEAAARANADLVEMDVMQTKDGQFVAMHDAVLTRLAGRDVAVKDLTLEELTQIEVRDLQGHVDTIPTFTEYVTRAAELGMPLLVEIKLGGGDTPDHVERLVAELEGLGLLESNIYHSLDPASVAELKRLRPDLTVGYTMAFAGGDVPVTPADFIVVEEWTATESMQLAAQSAGLGFYAWTVNAEPSIREHLRRSTDGIITDHPDIAVSARNEMEQETGFAGVLIDAFTRFVTVV